MRRSLSIFALGLAASAMPATAIDVFPFTEEISRTYDSVSRAGTSSYSTRFDGIAVLGGDSTHVLHFAGGGDDGLRMGFRDAALQGRGRGDRACRQLRELHDRVVHRRTSVLKGRCHRTRGSARVLSPESTPTAESYADRVGLVRSAHGTQVDSLQRIEEIVAVEPATWTCVRELYL